MFLYLDIPVMAAVNLLSVFIYWYSIYGLGIRTIETRDDRLIGWLVYSELMGHNLLATWYLSTAAGFQFYIYMLAFLPFFIFTYSRTVYIFRVLLVIVISLVLEISGRFHSPNVPISPETLSLLHLLNLSIFLGVLTILSYLYTHYERAHHDLLETRSSQDPVTGLYNRRYIYDLVAAEWHDRNLWPAPALILIDIDYFKRINDTWGHSCGDRAIITVATALKHTAFPPAVVSRWGGEEFLILFRHIAPEELRGTAEDLRKSIARLSIPCGNTAINLTVTLGATTVRENDSFEETLHRADRALYRGKESGRDRVVLL